MEIKSRMVSIESLKIIRSDADHATFEARCGKGTYVRSLARDMGRELKCYGHISALRRTSVGPFLEEDMVELDTLLAMEGNFEALDSELFTTGTALEDLVEVQVNREQATRLRRGNKILVRGKDAIAHANEAFASLGDELIAIGAIDRGQFSPKRVFLHSFV